MEIVSPLIDLRSSYPRIGVAKFPLMFVTLFFGVFDPVDGSLTYANAGHPAPFLYRSDGCCVALEPTADAVLGIMEDEDYAVAQVKLCPGDGLFLFSDGVPEAMNGSGGNVCIRSSAVPAMWTLRNVAI